jgi:hypothetical protein
MGKYPSVAKKHTIKLGLYHFWAYFRAMKIPQELLNNWKGLRTHGDNTKIAEKYGTTKMQITRAFKGRSVPDEVFEAIQKFYTDKENRLLPTKSNNEQH